MVCIARSWFGMQELVRHMIRFLFEAVYWQISWCHRGFNSLVYRQLSANFMVVTMILFAHTTFLEHKSRGQTKFSSTSLIPLLDVKHSNILQPVLDSTKRHKNNAESTAPYINSNRNNIETFFKNNIISLLNYPCVNPGHLSFEFSKRLVDWSYKCNTEAHIDIHVERAICISTYRNRWFYL
jgi:hypothetical protein